MYALIIVDLKFLIVNGGACTTQIAEKLQNSNKEGLKRPQICCITGLNSYKAERLLVASIDETLSKPISKQDLHQ